MAWIESHQTLRDHPKLSDLAHRLGISKAQAIGHLQMLWWWCINYAQDGDISRFTPIQIAAACDWGGDPETLIQHLTASGFIDSEPLRVHDWLDFCGDLIKKRLEYKKAKYRRTKRLGKSLRKPEISQLTVTIPDRNQTVTEPTRNNVAHSPKVFSKPTPQEVTDYAKTIGLTFDGSRFVDYYEANGWKVGRNAMKSWQAAVRTWKSNGFSTGNGYSKPAMPTPAPYKFKKPDENELPLPSELKGLLSGLGRPITK